MSTPLSSSETPYDRISGHGTSLWKDHMIQFTISGIFDPSTGHVEIHKTHTGRYTNTLIYHGTFEASKGKITATFRGGSLVLMQTRPDTAYLLASKGGISVGCAVDGMASYAPNMKGDIVSEVAHYMDEAFALKSPLEELSGSWLGMSVRLSDMGLTLWRDVSVSFMAISEGTAIVEGKGVSLWNGSSSDFDISGRLNTTDMVAQITKTHKSSSFSNSVSWNAHVDFENKRIRGKAQDCVMILEQCVVNPMLSRASSTESNSSVATEVRRGPHSRMRLDVHAAEQVSIQSRTSSRSPTSYSPPPSSSHSNPRSPSSPSSAAVAALASAPDAPLLERTNSSFEHYKLYLEAMMSTGPLSEKQRTALARFRAEYGISDLDHELAVEQLRLNSQQLRQQQQRPPYKAEEAKQEKESDNACKICFDNEINCVLLPCGHLVICLACSERLSDCPLCRAPITEAKVVFRS